LVRDSDLTEPAKPDGVLPFAVEQDAACAAFVRWAAHRWFAPRTLKGGARIGAVDGVFLPFWTFSADSSSTYAGERGSTSSRQVPRTRTNADGTIENYFETESYTDWHRVAGRVARHFEGLVSPACSPLAERIPHWSLERLVPYARGATADRRIIAYDIDPADGFRQAAESTRRQIERDVRDDIGGEQQQVREVATRFADERCGLLLLPAWLVSYSHGGRDFSALVNGVSGEVAGDRPYSGVKIGVLVGASVLVAALVALLVWLR
jgi:hypothetical protein